MAILAIPAVSQVIQSGAASGGAMAYRWLLPVFASFAIVTYALGVPVSDDIQTAGPAGLLGWYYGGVSLPDVTGLGVPLTALAGQVKGVLKACFNPEAAFIMAEGP